MRLARQATADAFAALRADGRVVTWGDRAGGGDSSSVETQLREVRHIQGKDGASKHGLQI